VNGTVGSILGRKGLEIWSVTPDATVYDAIALMASKTVGALLVISDGNLLGIVSEVDYARRVILQRRSSKEARVRDIMTSNPITVTPEDTVDDCLRIMTHHRIRHLPVLEGLELVGMVNWRFGKLDYC
jgi:CBS domain-containing protein